MSQYLSRGAIVDRRRWGRQAPNIILSDTERNALEALCRQRTAPQLVVMRARIVLLAAEGMGSVEIGGALSVSPDMVGTWRQRWSRQSGVPLEEGSLEEGSLEKRLSDVPRPGKPARILPEQYCEIMAVACEEPAKSGRPITNWTTGELASEVIRRGIVETISPRQIGRFFKRSGTQAPPNTVLVSKSARRTTPS